MNKYVIALAALMITTSFTACGKDKAASSSMPASSSTSAISSSLASSSQSAPKLTSSSMAGTSSASSSLSVTSTSGTASSGTASSGTAPVASSSSGASSIIIDAGVTQDSPLAFVTVVPKGQNQTQLLEVRMPTGWSFDGYSIFTTNKIKQFEFISMQAASETAPFPADYLKKYDANKAADGANGLQAIYDGAYGGHKCRIYVYRALPKDMDKPYHVYFTLLNFGGFTAEMVYYSEDVSTTEIPEQLQNVLANCNLVDLESYSANSTSNANSN